MFKSLKIYKDNMISIKIRLKEKIKSLSVNEIPIYTNRKFHIKPWHLLNQYFLIAAKSVYY